MNRTTKRAGEVAWTRTRKRGGRGSEPREPAADRHAGSEVRDRDFLSPVVVVTPTAAEEEEQDDDQEE